MIYVPSAPEVENFIVDWHKLRAKWVGQFVWVQHPRLERRLSTVGKVASITAMVADISRANPIQRLVIETPDFTSKEFLNAWEQLSADDLLFQHDVLSQTPFGCRNTG